MENVVADESNGAFVRRGLSALLRLVFLALFGAAHWALTRGVRFVVPSNITPAYLWLEDISFAFFALIYVYLMWDFAKVFIPWIPARLNRGKDDDGTGSDAER